MSRRQFLERMSVIVSDDRVLDALYQKGDGGTPVLLAPSREDSMMEQAAFAELCFGFCSNGQATLRFNFGGVGASSSGALRRSRARDLADLEAAHAHLRETLSRRCALVVHGSAGALVGGNESTFTKVAFIDPSEKDLEPWLNSARKTDAQIFLSEHHLERQSISKRCAGERVNVIANARPGFERGLPQLRREIVDFISA